MASKQRIAALGKYLLALSLSFNAAGCTTKPTDLPDTPKKTSGRKKALAVLYIINDVLYHRKYIEPDPLFADELQGFLADLVGSVLYTGAVKQLRRVNHVLDQWHEKKYFPTTFLDVLRTRTREISSPKTAGTPSQASDQKSTAETAKTVPQEDAEKPLRLPAHHGDPSLPFYDLPAANMLPHIIPNSTLPINPRLVRPIQFPNSTPSEGLSTAVQDLLNSAKAMFNGESIGELDSDAVGGIWGKDGEGYYGWSRTFCERMLEKRKGGGKEREKGGTAYSSDRSSRSLSRSRSHSRRRRRRSSSYSTSRSRSRSGSRSRSHLRGSKRRKSYDSRNRSRSRSRSGSRSRSMSRSRSRSRSISRSRSASTGQPSFQQGTNHPPPTAAYQHQQGSASLPHPDFAPNMQQSMAGYGQPPMPHQQQQQQQQQHLPSYAQFSPYTNPAMQSAPVPGTIPPNPNQLIQQLMQFQHYGFAPPPPPPPNGFDGAAVPLPPPPPAALLQHFQAQGFGAWPPGGMGFPAAPPPLPNQQQPQGYQHAQHQAPPPQTPPPSQNQTQDPRGGHRRPGGYGGQGLGYRG